MYFLERIVQFLPSKKMRFPTTFFVIVIFTIFLFQSDSKIIKAKYESYTSYCLRNFITDLEGVDIVRVTTNIFLNIW